MKQFLIDLAFWLFCLLGFWVCMVSFQEEKHLLIKAIICMPLTVAFLFSIIAPIQMIWKLVKKEYEP